MRAKQMGVPRLALLGSYAYYTHRASGIVGGSDLRDIPPREWRAGERVRRRVLRELGAAPEDKFGLTYTRLQPPRKGLTRWVVVWPECGYGTVVGLTYRSAGRAVQGSGDGYDYEGPYFDEQVRYPVYEVRTSLTSKRTLVPVWALVPQLPGAHWSVFHADHHPMIYTAPGVGVDLSAGKAAWAAYVARWFDPAPLRLPVA